MSSKITLTQHIDLQLIKVKDHQVLFNLMADIYLPAYKHYWNDGGNWYLNFLYNQQKIKAELSEPNSIYFFVLVEGEKIGILKIQHHKVCPDFPDKKASKLHRIYLHPKFHGTGIASTLLDWTVAEAQKVGSEILWLDAMEAQEQALRFYQKKGFIIGTLVSFDFERLFPELRGMYQMWRTI